MFDLLLLSQMRHWLRLADSEADAWQFLAMLRIQFSSERLFSECVQGYLTYFD